MNTKTQQSGFTITEMMVGVAVGLIVTAGVASFFMSTLTSSKTLLESSKLNQELNMAMNIMMTEIRRAGYWEFANGVDKPDSVDKIVGDKFTKTDIQTMLDAFETANGFAVNGIGLTNPFYESANNIAIHTINNTGDCILFAYDYDEIDGTAVSDAGYGTAEGSDFRGFKIETNDDGINELKMRITGSVTDDTDCNHTDDTWQSITDPDMITISTLSFTTTGSKCSNLDVDADPVVAADDAITSACTTAANSRNVEVRQINIVITGALKNDSSTEKTLTSTVKVRNDYIQNIAPSPTPSP